MTHALASNRFGIGGSALDPVAQDWRDRLRSELMAFRPRHPLLGQLPGASAYAGFLSESLNPALAGQVSASMPPYIVGSSSWKPVEALIPRDINARLAVAITEAGSFPERLVHFWQNHFAVSSVGGQIMAFSPSFEFDAIRPNIMGKFRDLVLAVLRHPAMLWYLGNIDSFGPNSAAGRFGLGTSGFNENLGRELLELHTLGVDGGYTQQDVIQVALALTGWSVSSVSTEVPYNGRTLKTTPGAFIFQPDWHELGTRTVMGKAYPQEGEDQLVAIVTDLCLKPACAEFVARKISRHFLREDGNDVELVAALKAAYLNSGGDLKQVYQALIAAFNPALMQPKIKSPNDWVISICRAIGAAPPTQFLSDAVVACDQSIWSPGSPAGWPDRSNYWLSSPAMVKRANAIIYLLARYASLPTVDAAAAASKVGFASSTIAAAKAQATPADRLAVLFCSPEFMRR